MFGSGLNLVSAALGFGMTAAFAAFVCVRFLCCRERRCDTRAPPTPDFAAEFDVPTKLNEAAGLHQEKISSAPVPIVEHFALVLGRKPNHSRGVGIRAVNRVAEERIRLQAQIETSEQREAAARARADAAEQRAEAAEQRAQALEGQVSTVVETNAQMQEEQQSQRDELSSLRQAQSGEVARLVREQLDQQMAELIARIQSGVSQPPAS